MGPARRRPLGRPGEPGHRVPGRRDSLAAHRGPDAGPAGPDRRTLRDRGRRRDHRRVQPRRRDGGAPGRIPPRRRQPGEPRSAERWTTGSCPAWTVGTPRARPAPPSRPRGRRGCDNISVDLIYGLPGLDLATWTATVREVLAWGPDHLSAYGLTLDEGSLWHARGVSGAPARGGGHRAVLGPRGGGRGGRLRAL